MRILLFRTDPSVLNIKNYNSQEIGMAKSYIKQGHQCDIVYYAGNRTSQKEIIHIDDKNSITLYWMKGFSILNNGIFPGISRIIDKYDIIQVSEYYFFSSWYVCTKYRKKKKVYIYQGVYDSDNSVKFKIRCKFMDPLLLNKKIQNEIPVFVKSKMAYESMQRRGFKKILTVGVGLDVGRLKIQQGLSQWAESLLQNKGNCKYLLYIGVLEDRRNTIFLLSVFKTLLRERKNENIKLILVGKGEKGYVEKCKQFIKDNNMVNHIIYFESINQSEISNIYTISDIFLFPSKYEIFGMVLLEAMHFGLPVISSYNGGSSTIIENGLNGIIVNDFDVNEWVNAIKKILDNASLRRELSTKARQTASTDFGWGNITNRILKELDV